MLNTIKELLISIVIVWSLICTLAFPIAFTMWHDKSNEVNYYKALYEEAVTQNKPEIYQLTF